MEDTTAVRLLTALAQPHRLAAFRALVVAGTGGMTPGVLAERLQLPPATLSFHLKELSHAGLVAATRDGRHLVYRADYARMNELLSFLTAHCCAGEPCAVSASTCGC